MIVFCILISAIYACMIAAIFILSIKPSPVKTRVKFEHKRFSVVVAARNESHNIGPCLKALLAQQYPADHFEIIVVDDHSTDDTYKQLRETKGISALSLEEGQGKKAALALGISAAKYEYIATTDADCVVGERWLAKLNESFNQSGATLITGPVKISPCDRMLSAFEAMDVAITMVVTAFGIQRKLYYLANGANLAFAKKVYEATGGYQNHIHHASGDDVFFYAEAALQGNRIGFAGDAEAIVTTRPQQGWKQLLQQRKRWATKTRAYAGLNIWMVQGMVVLVNISLLMMLILGFFNPSAWFGGAVILISKGVIDFIALWLATGWQNNRRAMKFFLQGQIVYLFIILFSARHALITGSYNWKGREVR